MTSRTVLGFDYGTKSIGIAVGQEITGTASPEAALKANDGVPNWEQVETVLKHWQPDLVVVGLPLNMDGTEQELTKRARKFANRIHGRFGLPIALQDERLTTVDARARLFEMGGFKALTKDKVDSVSAVLIIESFFETQY